MRSILFMSNRKYSKEFKLQLLKEHEQGASFYSLEKEHGIAFGTIRNWYAAMKKNGPDALERRNSMLCRYTADFKMQVVKDYLSGGESYLTVALKYGINGETTVRNWVMQYNNHEELTDTRNIGGPLMAEKIKGRTTTLEERIKIVEYCISHSNNYSATAKEYSCSYNQVYSWVQKYNSKGIDGLKDGRGRNKSVEELSDQERLEAENRLLKAELKKKQMELDLLKKLEEIERR